MYLIEYLQWSIQILFLFMHIHGMDSAEVKSDNIKEYHAFAGKEWKQVSRITPFLK